MNWDDAEFQALLMVTDRLSQLDEAAQLRVLRYAVDRLELKAIVLRARLVPDVERVEEIGSEL